MTYKEFKGQIKKGLKECLQQVKNDLDLIPKPTPKLTIGDKIKAVIKGNPEVRENIRKLKAMRYLAKHNPKKYELTLSDSYTVRLVNIEDSSKWPETVHMNSLENYYHKLMVSQTQKPF